tara:strand:- start:7713 stop:8408 length:696 start_codon:yes stop_codon:yes gene_type:complete
MEYTTIIIEAADTLQYGFLAGLGVKLLPSLISGVGSLFGKRKRRNEFNASKSAYNQAMQSYKDFEFENLYSNLENPFEDLRVSTEAAEFQSQQLQQQSAQTLDALRGAGGGTGAAAIATSLAQAQARNQQRIAADIAKQEVANERLAAQGQFSMQSQEAKAGMDIQKQEFGRESTIFGMEQQNYAAALEARAKQREAGSKGLGALGAVVGGGLLGKGTFLENVAGMFKPGG